MEAEDERGRDQQGPILDEETQHCHLKKGVSRHYGCFTMAHILSPFCGHCNLQVALLVVLIIHYTATVPYGTYYTYTIVL